MKNKFIKGTPQSLETLFSPQQFHIVSNGWQFHKERLIKLMDVGAAVETYRRTIINFMSNDDPRKNRHAFRIAHNARELLDYGFIKPHLTNETINRLNKLIVLPFNVRVHKIYDLYDWM